MISALLTGVNRAYPFAKLDSQGLSNHTETLFKVVHVTTNFNVTLHAFMLLYQVQGEADADDRFYSAFYRKLLDANFSGISKHALLLNLVFKVLKNDPIPSRMIAITKRILQIALFQQPHLICSMLFLISELIKTRHNEAKLLEKVLETSSQGALLKDESDDDLDDDFKVDIDTDSDNDMEKQPKAGPSSSGSSSWIHKSLVGQTSSGKKSDLKVVYDPMARNPAYAGADKTNHWELSEISNHFHPSVALFANTILQGSPIKYSGDPLQDFTLVRFLDRFVFRNPKKVSEQQKTSSTFGKRSLYRPKGVKSLAPDSKEYLNKDLEQIPIEERFIYKYLKDKRSKETEEADSDAESVDSVDWNEAIDRINPDQDDLDFASKLQTAAAENNEQNSSDDSDENDDDQDMEENDEDFEEIEDFDGLEDDDLDKEDFEDESSDEDGEENYEPELKKKKKFNKQSAAGGDLQSLLASADDFAAMIDENAQAGQSTDTMEAVFNRDKSHAKQMKWEEKRTKQKKK
jgi:ribosome biogenesis protein MAK21